MDILIGYLIGKEHISEKLSKIEASMINDKELLKVVQNLDARGLFVTADKIVNAGFGAAYIHDLVMAARCIRSDADYDYYLEKARRVKMSEEIQAAGILINKYGELADEKTAAEAIEILSKIKTAKPEKTAQEILRERLQLYHDIHDGKVKRGLDTGIKSLDDKIMGLEPGKSYVIAARPSMGKTTLVTNICDNVAKAGKSVAFFELEMSVDEIMDRRLAAEACINGLRLKDGKLTNEDFEKLEAAADSLQDLDFHIYTEYRTVEKIKLKSMQLKASSGLDLIVIDYLQILSKSSKQSIYEAVTTASQELHALAIELNVPIIILSQLSRQCESRPDKHPIMSDLRESGAVEQDADVIIMMYDDTVYTGDYARIKDIELEIVKNRSGEKGVVIVKSIPEYTRMYDPDDADFRKAYANICSPF